MTKDELIMELAYYTQVLDDALENETEHGNRPHHLGHLAMAARMFKILHLNESMRDLDQILRIESSAYWIVKLPGPCAAATREAWRKLSPNLRAYMDRTPTNE